jgi:Uncharacterized protein conserved in bacteria (DUF2188)
VWRWAKLQRNLPLGSRFRITSSRFWGGEVGGVVKRQPPPDPILLRLYLSPTTLYNAVEMKKGVSKRSVSRAGKGILKSPITVRTANGVKISIQSSIAAKAKNQHVVPFDGRWAVCRAGSNKATFVFEVKSDAIDVARNLAKRQGTDLIVHGRSGQIFQHSEVKNTIGEKKIRDVIRTSVKGSTPKTLTEKKLQVRKSARGLKK